MSDALVHDRLFRQSLIISLAYKYFVFGVVCGIDILEKPKGIVFWRSRQHVLQYTF